jgi:hypothetical protein
MKKLANQTLLYDADCPLCRVYTTGFIQMGMLDENGKKPYCQLTEIEQGFVDIKRAANEIALVDYQNKTVLYGIDSLLKVIGFSFPWIEKIGNYKPVKFGLKKLYSFISYNRKVIIPNTEKTEIKLQCVPDFNFKYRSIYIGFAGIITVLVLFNFSNLISVFPKTSIFREIFLAFGQIAFQLVFLSKYNRQTQINYIGNLMTVSLIGSLFLIPILILNNCFKINEIYSLIWFGFAVFFMFFEHSRRIKILNLPFYLSITWVIYRIIAFFLILNISE